MTKTYNELRELLKNTEYSTKYFFTNDMTRIYKNDTLLLTINKNNNIKIKNNDDNFFNQFINEFTDYVNTNIETRRPQCSYYIIFDKTYNKKQNKTYYTCIDLYAQQFIINTTANEPFAISPSYMNDFKKQCIEFNELDKFNVFMQYAVPAYKYPAR